MRKSVWKVLAITGLAVMALHCAPRPTEKEMAGKVKGKASLRLSDGSTISQDGSDEYNPYIVRLSDGYLALVFGSNRSGLHNIYMTKSIEPFNGFEIPFFAPPVMVTNNGPAINDADKISFAAVASGTSVELYINLHSDSYFINKGVVTNPNSPNITPALASITNSGQQDHTIIGVSDDGTNLITTDLSGIAYAINPNQTTAGGTYGFGLDYATSATQVRFDNTGYNDSMMGTYYGSTVATTGSFPFGPIIDFDFSLLEAGLFITHINTLYGASAAEDVVIFSANDGISDDMYVVTSHTSGMLWQTVAGFGFDTFIPPAPPANHHYDFESTFNCSSTFPNDVGFDVPWNASACTSVTRVASSYNGSFYANFTGSPNVDLGGQNLGTSFTIAAWVYIPATNCNSTICTIIANAGSTTSETGFRLAYAGSPTGTLQFITGNGSTSMTAESMQIDNGLPFNIEDGNWHHIAVTATPGTGMAWLYLDGGLVNATFDAEATFSTNTVSLWLGMMTNSQNAFLGRMDDVKIFSYELDPMSVLALYLE